MNHLNRFGISMNSELLRRFDEHIKEKGYRNRSEAIRDLVRDRLVQTEWEDMSGEQMGILSMIYNHQTPNLTKRIVQIQTRHYPLVISTMRINLKNDYCLEVMAVRGDSSEIRKFCNFLLSLRGVKHGQLMITGTETTFSE